MIGLRLRLTSRRRWPEIWRLVGEIGRQLLFPSRCATCTAVGHTLCPACLEQAVCFAPPRCPRCDSPLTSGHACSLPSSLDGLCTVGPHVGVLRQAVHALKYEQRTDVASPLGLLLTARWVDTGRTVDGIIPVPLGPRRLSERGYNQAKLIAREMAVGLGVEIAPALLRVRETRPQVGLTREERLRNVEGAFRASPEVAGGCWLLVDDVCTTGATLGACAVALKAAGARQVYAITLTRAADDVPVVPLAEYLDVLQAKQ